MLLNLVYVILYYMCMTTHRHQHTHTHTHPPIYTTNQLGHEISHVVLRHSAEQMARAAALNYLFIFLALMGLPINELTLLLGDLTIAKPNSRTHEVGGMCDGMDCWVVGLCALPVSLGRMDTDNMTTKLSHTIIYTYAQIYQNKQKHT